MSNINENFTDSDSFKLDGDLHLDGKIKAKSYLVLDENIDKRGLYNLASKNIYFDEQKIGINNEKPIKSLDVKGDMKIKGRSHLNYLNIEGGLCLKNSDTGKENCLDQDFLNKVDNDLDSFTKTAINDRKIAKQKITSMMRAERAKLRALKAKKRAEIALKRKVAEEIAKQKALKIKKALEEARRKAREETDRVKRKLAIAEAKKKAAELKLAKEKQEEKKRLADEAAKKAAEAKKKADLEAKKAAEAKRKAAEAERKRKALIAKRKAIEKARKSAIEGVKNVVSPSYNLDFRTNSRSGIKDKSSGLKAVYNGGMISTKDKGAVLDGYDDFIKLSPYTFSDKGFSLEYFASINEVNDANVTFMFGFEKSKKERDWGIGQQLTQFQGNHRGLHLTFANIENHPEHNYTKKLALPPIGKYNHYVVSFNDKSIAKFYINGKLVETKNMKKVVNGTRRASYIGASSYLSRTKKSEFAKERFTKMNIKYFRIWNNYELTPKDVNFLYISRNIAEAKFVKPSAKFPLDPNNIPITDGLAHRYTVESFTGNYYDLGSNSGNRAKSIKNINLDKALAGDDYVITSKIVVNGSNPSWRNIFHYGNNNGERMPALWLFPNFGRRNWRFHFRIRTSRSTNDGIDFDVPGNLRVFNVPLEIKITVKGNKKVHGSGLDGFKNLGQVKLSIFINGIHVGSKNLTGNIDLHLGRPMWIKDPWYNRDGYQVKSLYISSGKLLDMIGDKHAIVHSNFGTLSLVKSSKYLEGNDDLSKTFDYLEGNVHSSIEFPFNLNNNNWTIAYVTRYNPHKFADKDGRILSGGKSNWVAGHWHHRAGVSHQNGWLSHHNKDKIPEAKSWIFGIEQPNMFMRRSAKRNWKMFRGGRSIGTDRLFINAGSAGREKSDFDFAELVVFNRKLDNTELEKLKKYMEKKYIDSPKTKLPVTNGLQNSFNLDSYISEYSHVGSNIGNSSKIFANEEIDRALAGEDYVITTEIIIGFNHKSWRNIFHYGNNNGERMPALWIFPNNPWRFHFRVRTNSSHNDGFDFNIPSEFRKFNTKLEIKITVKGRKYVHDGGYLGGWKGHGPFVMEAFVNDVHAGHSNGVGKGKQHAHQHLGRTMWIKDPWHERRGYRVNSLRISSGKWLDSVTGNGVLVHSRGTGSLSLVEKNEFTKDPNDKIKKQFPYLEGSFKSQIEFPFNLRPNNWTIFYITRYKPKGKFSGRVLDGMKSNWLAGHWSGGAGLSHQNRWVNKSKLTHAKTWLFSIEQPGVYIRRNANTSWKKFAKSAPSIGNDRLAINFGRHKNEKSDFDIAELVVYNRILNMNEIEKIKKYIEKKYIIAEEPIVLSNSKKGGKHEGKEKFNNILKKQKLPFYIQWENPNATPTHRKIVYKRYTPIDKVDMWDLFTNNWFNSAKGVKNDMNTDFKLFNNIKDARRDVNSWNFCNFNDPGIGFPRDCGPNGGIGGQWISFKRVKGRGYGFGNWSLTLIT